MEKEKNEKNGNLIKEDSVLQKRERERRKRQIVDSYIGVLKKIFSKIIDLLGTPSLILTWQQTLERTVKAHPFLSEMIRHDLIEKHTILIRGISEAKNAQPVMDTIIDLDIDKLYVELPNIDEEELRAAFEELLNTFYDMGKVLFGSIVKFPIELEKEEA